MTSVNSNNKSSHVFAAICCDDHRRVCSLNLFSIINENNLGINVF